MIDDANRAGRTEWAWFNGQVMPLAEARLGPEDRGFQFADGVYEVVRVYDGACFALEAHLRRLEQSAAGILLPMPMPPAELAGQMESLVRRSGLAHATVYLQLTRGPSRRDHQFPDPAACPPTLLFYVRAFPPPPQVGAARGLRLLSAPDDRWQRCWIKSIALLPNVLAKNAALSRGADEAVFIDNGVVTEGASTNVFAVIDGAVATHPVGAKVLPGVTRLVLSEIAAELGIRWVERPIGKDEAQAAGEVFITSTTRELAWVARWDDREISQTCGPLTRRLHAAFRERVGGKRVDSSQ